MQSKPYLLSSIAVLLLAAVAPAQNTILALVYNGNALHIDATTGVMTPLGPSGVAAAGCMALHPTTGLYYTIAGPGFTLYTLNPATGVATSAGVTFNMPGMSYVGSLAIPPSGVGYAVADGNKLWSLNLSTGAATQIALLNPSGVNGLAANAAGTLYGWAVNCCAPSGTLATINPANGAITTIGTGAGSMQSLAFSPLGVLYGARDQLYSISTATGATTAIGAGGYGDVRAIEFTTDPVPPATLSFIPGNGVVAPGGIVAVLYHAPGHGGETFAVVPSCTIGTFIAPFLPQPLGIAWDFCTDFYFNAPGSLSILPLAGSPASFTGTLDAAGNAIGFVLPPASFPSGLNIPIHITFVTWTPSNSFTVGGVGTALLY